ncbi:putative transferase, protein kinase RLK-Pelle-RLCK-VIIa-2 family [Helianthus annuus]|nr:putative transferase, protein kinase RLK-Pelle-RLCK-VIIa-2 family [Helianthus annuus]KAJ0759565.1 putative transferase, protein kinase RLK-Pelle-RLCK-VIIa-2 family [Helianthus annuus]
MINNFADDHLEPLSWDTRLKVMIGVARGLTHLYTEKGVMCHFLCDDILLDEDFNAKIGGFGWSKIRDKMRQKEAFGYLKADYDISTGDLLTRNDICSFGFVMLETLTGRDLSNLDVLEGLESLELRAPKSKSNRRKLKKMMDPRLKDSYSIDGAFKCMALALRCITIRSKYRPSREEIVWSLEQIVALNK